jgi:hypothetical protein
MNFSALQKGIHCDIYMRFTNPHSTHSCQYLIIPLMKPNTAFWLLSIVACLTLPANAADPVKETTPEQESPAKGLELRCAPFQTNANYSEKLTILCLVTNTTDLVKPLEISDLHFCLVKDGDPFHTGQVPKITVRWREGIEVKQAHVEQTLYIPPHSWLNLEFSVGAVYQGKFKGKIVYDPVVHGGGFFGDDALEKAKKACVYSNDIEFNVVDPGTLQ